VALGNKSAKSIQIPGDPSMVAILALYEAHSAGRGDVHAYLRLAPWAQLYKASQAREFAAHVIRDMQKKKKDGKQVYADGTINRSLATAKKGLSLAFEQTLTPVNYCQNIKVLTLNNEVETVLSVQEVNLIASHCSAQAQAAIWFALMTGARRGEILKLTEAYIGTDTVTFTRTTTKSKRTRVVPIVAALRPWLVHFPLTITVDGIKSAWRRARIKAKLPHARFHDLRHSCASILVAHGIDLYTIGKILGHANPKTTARYAHLQVEQQRHALTKISTLLLPA
jgi:integrase